MMQRMKLVRPTSRKALPLIRRKMGVPVTKQAMRSWRKRYQKRLMGR